MFQSQTRSRSTCDLSFMVNTLSPLLCFNLRREAAPHATFLFFLQAYAILRFQSQTRSRSTCDHRTQPYRRLSSCVSISDEKPLHMRRHSTSNPTTARLVSISDEKPLHMRRIAA